MKGYPGSPLPGCPTASQDAQNSSADAGRDGATGARCLHCPRAISARGCTPRGPRGRNKLVPATRDRQSCFDSALSPARQAPSATLRGERGEGRRAAAARSRPTVPAGASAWLQHLPAICPLPASTCLVPGPCAAATTPTGAGATQAVLALIVQPRPRPRSRPRPEHNCTCHAALALGAAACHVCPPLSFQTTGVLGRVQEIPCPARREGGSKARGKCMRVWAWVPPQSRTRLFVHSHTRTLVEPRRPSRVPDRQVQRKKESRPKPRQAQACRLLRSPLAETSSATPTNLCAAGGSQGELTRAALRNTVCLSSRATHRRQLRGLREHAASCPLLAISLTRDVCFRTHTALAALTALQPPTRPDLLDCAVPAAAASVSARPRRPCRTPRARLSTLAHPSGVATQLYRHRIKPSASFHILSAESALQHNAPHPHPHLPHAPHAYRPSNN